jgi:glycosyltransferase involved in cell wall biosynthesis
MTIRHRGPESRGRSPQEQPPLAGLTATDLQGARVIIANWRDPWHPEAGGAERYAWEMALALTARGAVVRYLTARGPGQSARERVSGIEVIRRGGRFTLYPLAASWLLAQRGSADIVLDCQNGIPFFTPLVLPRRVPVLCVMHHVHTAQFGVHFPAWMAVTGRILEGPVSRLAYRRHACVAVSPSTVAAMRDRLRWKGDIYLIPNGTPAPSPAPPSASPADSAASPGPVSHRPSLVWIGRLVAHKRAELLVPVAARGFSIDVIGRGPGSAALSAAIDAAAGTGPATAPAGAIRLHGYLSEQDKDALIGQALLHLNTSQGEGWGLCVLEAAALGVPTVAYDVEGLRDAVRDGQTGWLVRDGEELADVVERAVKELSDPARRAEMAAACRSWASQLSWPRAGERMCQLVAACLQRGTARAARSGAWIVAPDLVAEGPALDLLADAGATLVRPAELAERLLAQVLPAEGVPAEQPGEVSGAPGPADAAWPR